MLRGRRHAAGLHRLGEGDRARRHLGGGGAEAAFRGRDRASRPGDVEDRGEVDVEAEVAQVPRGAGTLQAAEHRPDRPHFGGRGDRRAPDPLHLSSLLVDHRQQRVAQAGRARDRLQAGEQTASGLAAGEVVVEEDHPGDPPLADRPPHRDRRLGAVEADRDSLAGEPLEREPARRARRRLLGVVSQGGPEGEGPGRQAASRGGRKPSPPGRSRRHRSILRVAWSRGQPSGAAPSLAPECRP